MEISAAPPVASEPVLVQLTTLAGAMLERSEELTDIVLARVHEEFPVYAAMIEPGLLRATTAGHLRSVFAPLARAEPPETDPARPNGRDRAGEGVPLTAIMDGYRVAFGVVWGEIVATAERLGLSAKAALDAATILIATLDAFTREMAVGYREEMAVQIRSEEQRRAALVQALLEGRLADTNLWEAADLLRLPQSGTYVVIAARVPDVGRHALPHIEHGLGGLGIDSAWRLMHDVEVGVACLPQPHDQLDRLVSALAAGGGGRVGVSPPYDDLRQTAQALRLARIAMRGALDRRQVVVFGRDPLSAAAASAPDIMPRVAHSVLGGLDGLPPEDRALLLDTFGAWLECDGSATAAAKRLYVHPNTVRYRLRRLEDRTGRSLSNPRAVAELSLAYEIDCGTAAMGSGTGFGLD